MAHHGHSEACCTIPPVVAKGYQEKGKYLEIDGMKIYATGPSTAKTAIFIIYDIFGFSPQGLQGADILAHADSSHQYQVFIPDFFLGSPCEPSWYPPDTDEKKEKLGAFFAGPAAPKPNVAKVGPLVKAIEKEVGGGIEQWASLGQCWGGKIISFTSQEGTPFKAAAEVHPAMIDPADGKGFTIPVCILASKDEDAEAVKAFGESLTVKSHIETFSDQIHGWMSARADLENPRVKEEYERGYKTLLEFYHEHL
ncbi:hypothetical protein MMC12_005597 [Toensbergia leucococca]|nr:hypothetical protein [Toensbergia leucococca]